MATKRKRRGRSTEQKRKALSSRSSRKTKAEQYAEMPYAEFSKYKADEAGVKGLSNILNTLYRAYNMRTKQFRRNDLYSFAEQAFKKGNPWYRPASRIAKGKSLEERRGELLSEINLYLKFFRDTTSSVAGIKQVNREQDIRVFGKDASGNPVMTMTPQQRIAFWDAWSTYEERYAKDPAVQARYLTTMQSIAMEMKVTDPFELERKIMESLQKGEITEYPEFLDYDKNSAEYWAARVRWIEQNLGYKDVTGEFDVGELNP